MGKPKIRFKGYQEDWEQRKLEAVLSLLKDGTHGTHQDAEEGPYLLSAKNIKNGQIIIDDSSDRKISEDEFNQIHTKFTLENGDILLTIVGSIGESAILESAGKFTFQRSVAFLRPSEEMTSRFLKTEIESVQFQKELNDRKSQSAQPGVYLGDLSKIPIYITSKEEQKKIGKYFSHLDNLITLHQRKCEEMKTLKKYMLQKMFPQNGQLVPQIRFSGFTEDWEQRKLGELVAIYDGVHQTPDYQDSGIMFLSVENIATLKSEKYISEEAFERDYKVYPEKGDILMTRIGDVGTTNVVETAEKVAFYVSLALLKPNGIDSYFLSNAMKTNAFQKGLRERTLVTAIPQKINKDEIGKINIFITNNDEEQKKIGAYFSNLDHLITLHQQKCDELRNIKKFMLQNMFI